LAQVTILSFNVRRTYLNSLTDMRVLGLASSCAAVSLTVESGAHGTSSPVESLRAEVEMVQKQIQHAGKVTPKVYETVQKLLTMVTSIIEPAIEESHASDQMLVLTVFREIIDCDAQYTKFLNGALKQQQLAVEGGRGKVVITTGEVDTAKEKYAKCLDDRDLLVRENNTRCCAEYQMCPNGGYGDCEIVKLSQGYVGCNYRERTGAECYAHAEKLIAPLESYFAEQDKKYEMARHLCAQFKASTEAKIKDCAALQEAVNAQAHMVNEISEQVNHGGIELVEGAKGECQQYKVCRNKAITSYLEIVGPCEKDAYGAGGDCVKNREEDRHSEWEATQEIKCMLDHYCQGGKFEEDLLEQCKQSITTFHLAISYPTLPASTPCEVPDCPSCPGCDECIDRPYYQYQTPCYETPVADPPVCVEAPDCPGWCTSEE